jgi:uncharacterized membrane protein
VATRATGRERERNLDRLLTFVDAVVAIAITLLVLPLVELTAEVGRATSVAQLLEENGAAFWAFLLSFAVIARLLFVQHRALEHVVAGNHRLELLLVVWTLTIVFLPFPTALVARAGDQAATKILYVGTIAVSTLVLGLVDHVVAGGEVVTDADGTTDMLVPLVNVALLLVALAIMLLVPVVSYFPMFLLALDDQVLRVLRRLRRTHAAAEVGEPPGTRP